MWQYVRHNNNNNNSNNHNVRKRNTLPHLAAATKPTICDFVRTNRYNDIAIAAAMEMAEGRALSRKAFFVAREGIK